MSQNLIDNVPVAEAGKCENATMGGKCKAVISKTTVEDFLYAQVKYEVCNQGQRYWFNQEEVHEIEQHNLQFQHVDDLETMVTTCFRRPEEGEVVKPMLTREVVSMMAKQYPELRTSHSTAIKVGRVLKMLNFEQKNLKQGSCYYVVPMVEAA